MARKTYWEKLKDPRWQKKRLEVLKRAKWTCESCDEQSKTLHVHHRAYRRNADPWDYADNELACLCEDCHEAEHASRNAVKETLASLDLGSVEMVRGYAESLLLKEREGDGDFYELQSFEWACGFSDGLPGLVDHPSRWWDMADQNSIIRGSEVRQRLAAQRPER